MRRFIPEIESLAETAMEALAAKNAAREAALGRCRDTIRNSANAIRAVHRADFATAQSLVDRAGQLLSEAKTALKDHLDIRHAGFVHDAEKEYAEARITLAIISDQGDLPGPDDLGVELAAYLNGLGEVVGELRRYLLDGLLHGGDIDRLVETLDVMDEIYGILVTFDYPDAMTGGLRRTTDNVRGILERTRGDLSFAARQRDLEERLRQFEEHLTT
jgi:translin